MNMRLMQLLTSVVRVSCVCNRLVAFLSMCEVRMTTPILLQKCDAIDAFTLVVEYVYLGKTDIDGGVTWE